MLGNKKIIALIEFLFFIALRSILFSGSSGLPGEFLYYGASAKSVARGRVSSGYFDGAATLFSNSSLIGQQETVHLAGLYSKLYLDTESGFFGFIIPTEQWGSFGAGYIYMKTTGIEIIDSNNDPKGSSDFTEAAYLLSYQRDLIGRALLAAVDFKFLTKNLFSENAAAFGLDLNFGYKCSGDFLPFDGAEAPVTMGVKFYNLVRPKLFSDEYPAGVTAGFKLNLFNNRLSPGLDFSKFERKGFDFYAGLEYLLHKDLRLRAGVNQSGLAAGFGLDFRNLNMSYAVTFQNALGQDLSLGQSHRLEFSANLGPKFKRAPGAALTDQQKIKARYSALKKTLRENMLLSGIDLLKNLRETYPSETKRVERELKSLLAAAEKRLEAADYKADAEYHYDRGAVHYLKNDLLQAFNEWKKVSAFDPNFREVRSFIKREIDLTRRLQLQKEIESLLSQAETFFSGGKYAEAISKYTEVLKLDKENLKAIDGIADSNAKIAEIRKEKEKDAEEARRKQEAEDEQKQKEAAEKMKKKEPPAPVKPAQEPVKKEKPQAPAKIDAEGAEEHYLEGLRKYYSGHLKAAIEEWELTLKLNPEHLKAQEAVKRAREKLEQ